MKTFLEPGKTMTFTAPTGGVTVDTPVLIGNLLVIPTNTVAQTLPFEGMTEGLFQNMPKASGQTWAEGALIYWDNTAKNFTTTSTSNYRVGCAGGVGGQQSGDTLATVRLSGLPVPTGA